MCEDMMFLDLLNIFYRVQTVIIQLSQADNDFSFEVPSNAISPSCKSSFTACVKKKKKRSYTQRLLTKVKVSIATILADPQ